MLDHGHEHPETSEARVLSHKAGKTGTQPWQKPWQNTQAWGLPSTNDWQMPPRPHPQQMYLQEGDDAYVSAGGETLAFEADKKLRWIKRMENNPVAEGCVSCKSSDEKCPGQSKRICLLGWARGQLWVDCVHGSVNVLPGNELHTSHTSAVRCVNHLTAKLFKEHMGNRTGDPGPWQKAWVTVQTLVLEYRWKILGCRDARVGCSPRSGPL